MVNYKNILLFITLLLLSSCNPLYTTVYKKPETGVSKYKHVEIQDFSKLEGEWVPYDSNITIPDMIANKLLEQNKFEIVDRSQKAISDMSSRVLLVRGTVTKFEAGCKFCEWLHFGINDSGLGSISIWVQLIDRQTDQVISEFSLRGKAIKPGHGNFRYIRVVDQTVEYINEING